MIGRWALIGVAAAALAGCEEERGYPGVAAGYGPPGYYGYGYPEYAYGGYGPYGYDDAYGAPYWGWYGGYYYPGTGVYVYDSHRRPYRWNGAQQSYWSGRLNGWRGDRRGVGPEWRGFTTGQTAQGGRGIAGARGYRGGRGEYPPQGAPATTAGQTTQAFRTDGQSGSGYRQPRGGGGYRGGGGGGRRQR